MSDIFAADGIAPCVYCAEGRVEIDIAGVDHIDGDDFYVGVCDRCGQQVEYDYDPIAEPHRTMPRREDDPA